MVKKITTKNLILTIMMFSFMWVVIGDLVAMHIQLIYGIEIQNHFIIAKKAKDQSSIYKLNKNKSLTNNNLQNFKFNFSSIAFLQTPQSIIAVLYIYSSGIISDNSNQTLSNKAPPQA